MMAKINGKTINPFGAGHRDGVEKTCCINTANRKDFVKSYLEATKILALGLDPYCACFCPPLAFMIRHSIELLLKNELLEKCGKTLNEITKGNHNLQSLMDQISCETKLFDYLSKDEIKCFHENDRGSVDFRYPVTKGNESTCNGLCCFGINEVIELCDNMLNFLDKEYPTL